MRGQASRVHACGGRRRPSRSTAPHRDCELVLQLGKEVFPLLVLVRSGVLEAEPTNRKENMSSSAAGRHDETQHRAPSVSPAARTVES